MGSARREASVVERESEAVCSEHNVPRHGPRSTPQRAAWHGTGRAARHSEQRGMAWAAQHATASSVPRNRANISCLNELLGKR